MTEKEKIRYSFNVRYGLSVIKTKFAKAGLELDTRYIDYCGECPRCGNAFKVYRGEVKDAATVSAFLNMEQQKGIAYCLCKKCANKISIYTARRDADITEERIFERIPDLKRSKKPGRAEILLEKRMLQKIYGLKE
ncbi:MAG: hypothetical protein GX878_05450 [Firmicutes bacterium]|nr:hypothetical protein [Bacillota bacterium]